MPLKIKLLSEFKLFRFILVGGLNTLIGMGIIFTFIYIGIDNYIANFCGYIIGLFIGYFLHKYYTFQSKSKVTIREFMKFVIIFIVSYSVNIMILYVLLFYMQNYFAQFFAMLGYTFVSYTLNKLFTFNKQL